MKKFFIFLVLVFACSALFGQTHEENARTLLEVTNSQQMVVQMLDALIPQIKALAQDVPEKYWQEFYSMFDYKELIDILVPVYMKYYTNEDIKELLRFYNTPVGKKMVRITPDLNAETMEAGQKWGEALGIKIVNKLMIDGYLSY